MKKPEKPPPKYPEYLLPWFESLKIAAHGAPGRNLYAGFKRQQAPIDQCECQAWAITLSDPNKGHQIKTCQVSALAQLMRQGQ